MAEDDRKTELMAELEAARSRATVNFRALRKDLDFPTRAKRAFARQPLAWIGGASFLGLIVSRLSFRKRKVVVVRKGKEPMIEKAEKAGLLLGILKLVFDLVRPALTTWVTKFVTEYAYRKMRPGRGV
jgi:hypothetical protein